MKSCRLYLNYKDIRVKVKCERVVIVKRKFYLFVVLICTLIFIGCEKKSDTNESEKDVATIMNVPINNISTIELYSKGKLTTISADSEEFLELAKIIDEAEDKGKDSVGGADLTDSSFIIPTGTTYAEYTKNEACRVYIVKFKEKQAVTYGDYSSKQPNEDGVFIIPEKNMFGIIINDEDGKPNSYETFMDVDRDIFEDAK